ncbi:hypothetical protein BDZ94DRAFT_1131447, partial [Collybia nuda]
TVPSSVIKSQEDLLNGYECPKAPPPEAFQAQPLTDSQYLSFQHYIAWRKTNGTVAAYNEHKSVLEQATGVDILSCYQVVKLAMDRTLLYPKVIDMCPKSCIAYTGDYIKLNCCPYSKGNVKCNTPRYRQTGKGKNIAHAQFKTLPILATIRAFYVNAETSYLLCHCDRTLKEVLKLLASVAQPESIKHYSGFANGDIHYLLRHKGLLSSEKDIALSISSDGAQLTMKKQSNTWVFIIMLLNFPPELRTQSDYSIHIFATLGPNPPGDVESF